MNIFMFELDDYFAYVKAIRSLESIGFTEDAFSDVYDEDEYISWCISIDVLNRIFVVHVWDDDPYSVDNEAFSNMYLYDFIKDIDKEIKEEET